jgi:hypothetical protein
METHDMALFPCELHRKNEAIPAIQLRQEQNETNRSVIPQA